MLSCIFPRFGKFARNLASSAIKDNFLRMSHFKCRFVKERPDAKLYPNSKAERIEVRDDQVGWKENFSDGYQPRSYTDQSVLNKPVWADEDLEKNASMSGDFKWNDIDNKISRKSHVAGGYKIVDSLPRNPIGRTGIKGRGLLGRWGPNHAGDPIVTRWKRDEANHVVQNQKSGKPILEFIAIRRRDTNEWAIPGGMVDPGEKVSQTVRREFSEETMNSLGMDKEERRELEIKLKQFFARGEEIYSGYVDDPRNTDNAWMETVAYNFHDEDGDFVAKFKLHAGDDAVGVQWLEISRDIVLYASHKEMIKRVVDRHNAHWSSDESLNQ